MVAVPVPIAVTVPSADTVATLVLLLDHSTALLVAVAGATTAVNFNVLPTEGSGNDDPVGVIDTPVTLILGLTVTTQVPVMPLPSAAVAVMVAVPRPDVTAVTTPSADTVAILELLLVHVTFLLVAFAGEMITISASVSPAFS